MTGRRELLFGVAGSLSVAGCLGSVGTERGLAQATTDDGDADPIDPDSASDSESTDEADADTETDADTEADPPKGLPGFRVENIELSYASHVGITTLITITSESGEGTQTAHLVTEAKQTDGLLGEVSAWEDIPTLTRPVELRMENIFDLYGNLGSISEFVIKGRVPDGEYGEIKSFSGSTFRDRVGVEDAAETDTDTDVEVDVESPEDDESDGGNDGGSTNETEVGGPTTDDGGSDEGSEDSGGSLADELDVDF
jgi:hypothetical protein